MITIKARDIRVGDVVHFGDTARTVVGVEVQGKRKNVVLTWANGSVGMADTRDRIQVTRAA